MEIDDIVSSRGLKKPKKVELLKLHHAAEFNAISSFVTSNEGIIACFKNRTFVQPKCEYTDCINIVPLTKASIFPRGCCIQHSQKIVFLEKYGVDNPMKDATVKEKQEQNNLEKFGVKNFSQTKLFSDLMSENNPMHLLENRIKSKKTCMERYGVENPMQLSDIASKVSKTHKAIFKEYGAKTKETNLSKYGHENPLKSKDIHQKSVETRKINSYFGRISNFTGVKPLFGVEEFNGVGLYVWECLVCANEFSFKIEDGKIPICRKCTPYLKNPYSVGEKELATWIQSLGISVVENSRTILQGREIDIFLPEYGLAIEYNGMYWHTESQGKGREYHVGKTNECENFGFSCMHISERDWVYRQEAVKSTLLRQLGIGLHLEELQVCEIDRSTFETFKLSHSLEDCSFLNIIGAYWEGELVGAMTYRVTESKDLILTCVVSDDKYGFKEIFQSMLQFLLEKIKDYQVYLQIDRRFWDCRIFLQFGFEKNSDTDPTPEYFKGKTEIHSIDELKNVYRKIWDCGNRIFKLKETV